MTSRNNCKPARGVSTGKMTAATWAAFDALPREVRRALWESPVPINPDSVAQALAWASVREVLARIERNIYQEVDLFAEQHRRRHGYELPHVAADVGMQRYGTRTF